MANKLGSYISNLMTTIVDKEERFFIRKLAFSELTKLKQDNGGVTDVNLSQHHSFRVRFYYCKVEV